MKHFFSRLNFKAIGFAAFSLAVFLLALKGLGDTLVPLLGALVLAYMMFPMIRRLEAKGISRIYAIATIFIGVLFLLALFFGAVVPQALLELGGFLRELPQTINTTLQKINVFLLTHDVPWQIDRPQIMSWLQHYLSKFSSDTALKIGDWLAHALGNFLGLIIGLMNLFLFPLFFFYIVSDYERISVAIKRCIPKRIVEPTIYFLQHTHVILSGYIRGQLTVLIVLAALYSAGLVLVGLKFGLFIGLMTGFLSIIPYVGFFLGFSSAMMVAYATNGSLGHMLMVFTVMFVVQSMESFVITPRFVGNKVGLSTLSAIIVLIIGGNLFGIWGIVFAIPTAAIIKFILTDFRKFCLHNHFSLVKN